MKKQIQYQKKRNAADFSGEIAKENVAFLLETIPQVSNSNTALILAYWKVFNGIDIPDKIIKQIIEKGSPPESITRYKRMLSGSA